MLIWVLRAGPAPVTAAAKPTMATQLTTPITATFDEMVMDGRMPPPKRIDTRCVWDSRQLSSAFDKLPGGADDDRNEWDEALQIPTEKRHGCH
jgi:hypothetical protein